MAVVGTGEGKVVETEDVMEVVGMVEEGMVVVLEEEVLVVVKKAVEMEEMVVKVVKVVQKEVEQVEVNSAYCLHILPISNHMLNQLEYNDNAPSNHMYNNTTLSDKKQDDTRYTQYLTQQYHLDVLIHLYIYLLYYQ